MNVIAIHMRHDATFAVKINGKYKVYEIERITKDRYARLTRKSDEYLEELAATLHGIIKKDFGENLTIHKLIYCDRAGRILRKLQRFFIDPYFNTDNLEVIQAFSHHEAHAACALYQSPYENTDTIIFSIDGSGVRKLAPRKYSYECFTVFLYENSELKQIYSGKDHYGLLYGRVGNVVKEINPKTHHQALAGKVMGLAAYGKVEKSSLAYKIMFDFYNHYKIKSPKRIPSTKYLQDSCGEHEEYVHDHSWDIAACNQDILEELVINQLRPYLEMYPNHNICITGGVGLNVVLNKKIADLAERPIFVPPNPNDSGQALGLLLNETKDFVGSSLVYEGVDMIGDLNPYIEKHNAHQPSMGEIAKLLNDGKIIGVAHGSSETGPRALGNRSIICDPYYPQMKDILNSKVKHREWFRPFAPFVRKDRCHKFFEFDGDSPFMSFAVEVKEEYRESLPSITHEDNTARVQTVTEYSHKFFYDLLTEFEKQTGKGVLLNTSFNIKGRPIINEIDDMFEVLETTDIDYILVNGYLFQKK